MSKPTAIDGSDGPLVVRRVVVWRRLEPGDVRTPGTELAPESPHLEAKVLEVGISRELFEDLERLEKKRGEVTAGASAWVTRYEPAGAVFATGGGLVVGAWLDYLPPFVLPFGAAVTALGVAAGMATRVLKLKRDREVEARWRATKEREELAKIERRLTPRWERFATKLREESGFRADVRVGDIHEADRLVSIDPSRITHPDTWRPDPKPNDVRYGWMYADGRVVEQRAELEDTDESEREADRPGEARGARERGDELGSEEDRTDRAPDRDGEAGDGEGDDDEGDDGGGDDRAGALGDGDAGERGDDDLDEDAVRSRRAR